MAPETNVRGISDRFSSGSASTSLPTWGTGTLHGQQLSIMPDAATALPASHRSSSADGDDSRFEDISDAEGEDPCATWLPPERS